MVVPVRGWPTMKIGRGTAAAPISGCCLRQSTMRKRLVIARAMSSAAISTPIALRRAS